MSIKVTRDHPALGSVEMEFSSFTELWEGLSIFSMPDKCDKCGSTTISPMFKKVMTKRQDAKVPFGTVVKTYGLRCQNGHEYYLGIHNDDTRELFDYSGRKFQDPYTNEQLATAEYREACEHCKSINQFHAKDCPNYTEKPQESRTEEKPAKVDNSPVKVTSTPTEAAKATAAQSASAVKPELTPIQVSRNRFVAAVGELGLSMGNVELATMLKSMLGVEAVPSPLTPEHWDTCYNLCNEYKVAAEIGGINLDANAISVMLAAVSNEVPGARPIEKYNAAEWKAATERAMEG